jgi:hypothetical protein
LHGLIACVIDCSRQGQLQLRCALGALSIGGRSWMLNDRLAFTDIGEASDQDQRNLIHLISSPYLLITRLDEVILTQGKLPSR